MYQSMTNYEQSNDFYRRQTCFTSNNSEVPSLNSPSNHQFHDPQYRLNQPQMLTFYPNLNRNPNMFSQMPGLSANRHFDEYPSGNCPYRLINMREGYRSSKLPPRPKNIVKITNPETGDNIFNELEKERKLNIPIESKNEDVENKAESVDSPQSSPATMSSTNLITQQPSIQNLTSEESQSPKAFHVPPGSCESNSLMTNSSASSRPPSVNLASSSQEMTTQNHSYFVPPAMNGHKGRQYFGRGGPMMDVPFNERPGFHDQSKSMYCNQLPMMVPTYGCRPPYVPSHVQQQMSGPRYGGYYNLPHNFYDQSNYYYEGEVGNQYFPHNNGTHGYQMHSRFPGMSHQNVPTSQSGSGSNSSEELNSECDIQFVSARLLDKSIRGRGSKYLRRESKEDVACKSEEDAPDDSNNSFDVRDSFGRPTPMEDSEKDSKSEDRQSSAPVKEITLDPNAKSFVYVGALADDGKQAMETSGDKPGGNGVEIFSISANLISAGLEMKRFSSKGSNMDHMDGDTLGRMKKNSMSVDIEDNKSSSSSSSKMFRSGSEGGNLEKNPVLMPNGMPVSSERRNTDTNIGKSGRIQYSRDFLLNLQFEPDSLKAPKGLAIFPEIILNGKVSDGHHRRQFIGGEHHHNIPPFMHPTNQGGFSHAPSMSLPSVMHPNLVVPNRYPYHHPIMLMPPSSNHQLPHHHPQPAPTMGRQVRGKSFAQQQQCLQQPSRKIIQVCLGKNVQLHQSENAWKPMTLLAGRKEDEVEGDEVEIMDLYRKVRSILNKLTPQKFDTLIQQVHDLSIDTEEKLKGCIKLIFEKAIGEPSFSLAYAQMAKSLNNLKVHVDERPGETVTFRKLLLNQCQKEFEKDKLEELDLEKMSKQIEQATSDRERQQLLEIRKEAEKVAKRRSLGNIRFIGELFKLKMLTDHIMFDCINRLLRYSGDEDNVECLCRLLVTIGKDLDCASPTSKQRLNLSIQELKHLSMKPQLSSRIRFMVQDVMELRENDWIPRREDTKPKLIEQIHKEAELERLGSSQQQHKTHHQSSSSSSSVPHDLQRSASLASSSLDHHRGSFDKSSLVQQQQNHHHHHQGRGSIDRNLRQQADRFGSLERVKMPDSFSGGGGGNGSSKLNVYATLGHNRRYPARPLTGGGNSMSSSDLGRTLDSLRGDTSAIQLAPSLYKQVQHKPWQEGSSGGGVRQINDVNPLPPNALRSRGSASDIYGRSFARSPIGIAPRSRVFDPKALERDKHAAIAAAKSISSSTSADSFINPPARVTRDPPHFSARAVTLSPRELANQKKELEKKCQSFLDEYLTTDDLQEACLTFREFHSSMKGCTTQMLALTNHLVNRSLEKSDKDRHKIAVLLSHLVLKNLIPVDTYLDSISSVLKDAQDTAIDIPKVWDYLAELVSRAILGKVFSFRNLAMLCVAIGNQEKQAEFVGHVIKTTTSGFVTELNAAVQPNFIADLILFLGNIGSNGKGDNRSLNEEQLRTHSAELKKCLVSTDLEWQVLMFIKNEIMGGSDVERAPSLLSSMLSTLQRCEILSSSTMARWNGSSNGCK